jgi:hypothetical protein
MEVGGQLHPCSFTPGKAIPNIDWLGGWVSPRASVDAAEKRKISCSCWELNLSSLDVKPTCLKVNQTAERIY